MKGKYLLEVHLPATGQHFDVWVAKGLQVQSCIRLFSTTFEELTLGRFQPGEDTTLCDFETGAIFDASLCMGDLELRDGSRVLLI